VVEPDCNALVVYDAGNRVLDDRNAGVFCDFAGDKILTIEEIRQDSGEAVKGPESILFAE
jgi:hypothetical protein